MLQTDPNPHKKVIKQLQTHGAISKGVRFLLVSIDRQLKEIKLKIVAILSRIPTLQYGLFNKNHANNPIKPEHLYGDRGF